MGAKKGKLAWFLQYEIILFWNLRRISDPTVYDMTIFSGMTSELKICLMTSSKIGPNLGKKGEIWVGPGQKSFIKVQTQSVPNFMLLVKCAQFHQNYAPLVPTILKHHKRATLLDCKLFFTNIKYVQSSSLWSLKFKLGHRIPFL